MNHRIALEERFDLPCARGMLDERKVKQVLYNLLSNAAKFTPDGGRITLHASQCPTHDLAERFKQDQTALRRKHDGEWLVVGVEDTGVGLKAELLEKIFDAFIQTEEGAKHAGTGLGLPLARSFVALHGGHLWATSPGPGLGSTFWLYLPIRPVPAEEE